MTSGTSVRERSVRAEGVLRWLIRSQSWVALGAFCQVLTLTYTVTYGRYTEGFVAGIYLAYAVAISFATLLFYTIYRHGFRTFERKIALGLLAFALISTIGFLISLDEGFLIVITIGAIPALVYWIGGKLYRNGSFFALIKPFLLAGTWAHFTTVGVMLVSGETSEALLLSRFLFFFALACAFDYRDVDADRRQGVRTLIARMGRVPAGLLAITCLLLSAVLPWAVIGSSHSATVIALTGTSILGAITMFWAFRQNRPSIFAYELVLDGLLILPLPIYLALEALT